MASSTDQRRDLKFMLRPTLSSFGVVTSDSSLNTPSFLATLPWSQHLFLGDLVFLVATSCSSRDLALCILPFLPQESSWWCRDLEITELTSFLLRLHFSVTTSILLLDWFLLVLAGDFDSAIILYKIIFE